MLIGNDFFFVVSGTKTNLFLLLLFIYFGAGLGLPSVHGLSLIATRELLTVLAPLVAEHRL